MSNQDRGLISKENRNNLIYKPLNVVNKITMKLDDYNTLWW